MSAAESIRVAHQEFQSYLRKLEQVKNDLPLEADRVQVKLWAVRLVNLSSQTLEELKCRNSIVFNLILQVQNKTLTAPFDRDPSNVRDLVGLARQLPSGNAQNIFPENFKLPQIMRQSPDQGAFLVTQPVPKSGAFCYLAVVSRPANR